MRIKVPHPSYFLIVSKIQYSFNNVAAVFFGIDYFWVYIPKKRLAEGHYMFFVRFFSKFFHTYIISKNRLFRYTKSYKNQRFFGALKSFNKNNLLGFLIYRNAFLFYFPDKRNPIFKIFRAVCDCFNARIHLYAFSA